MNWIKIASLLMFLGVALGAFGSHALKNKLSDHYQEVYKTGVWYHFFHALGLFVIAWLSTQTQDSKVTWAGFFMVAGIILFSGSLYLLSLTGIKWFGAITPLGGLSFIIAWLLIFCVRI